MGKGEKARIKESRTPLTQLYISNVFMTGIMSEWAMSTIQDNLATQRVPSLVRAWIESSKCGEDETSQNTINVQVLTRNQ